MRFLKCLVARGELGRVGVRRLFAIYQWGKPQAAEGGNAESRFKEAGRR